MLSNSKFKSTSTSINTLILLGGGHAHLAVLKQLESDMPSGWRVVLLTPSQYQTYSGMLPGWIAGHYQLRDCQINLRQLCERAGIELIIDAVVDIDADLQVVTQSNGLQQHYDLLSIDIGAETNIDTLASATAQLLPVRPLENFIQNWIGIESELKQGKLLRVAVVGAGAAGVELVLAMQYVKEKNQLPLELHFVGSNNGILSGFSQSVISRVKKEIERNRLKLYKAKAAAVDGKLSLSNGLIIPIDFIVAATGSRAPSFLNESKLALNKRGFIAVNEAQQSTSHPNVFAVGDIGSRSTEHAKSGVHAVRAGPVLAQNLIDVMQGQSPKTHYKPKKTTLYLLATGPKHAVASWGTFSAGGRWVWYWKRWIDRNFIAKYR
jgi:pyridine nucleotide-disulfide oxidoreductase family protein